MVVKVWRRREMQPSGHDQRGHVALIVTARTGVGLGHGFTPASRLRKAASPASDTSTHLGSGAALGT